MNKENLCYDYDIEFTKIIEDMINNKEVQKMKDIPQHYTTNTFDHCYHASYYCYKICKKLHLDYVSAARAAMVHDMFLYNWREPKSKTGRKGLHAFTHPRASLENASKEFEFNEKEKDIILKHMWPVTPIPPKYAEGFILTLVDKYCATAEGLSYFSKKKVWRYAYLLMAAFFIKG